MSLRARMKGIGHAARWTIEKKGAGGEVSYTANPTETACSMTAAMRRAATCFHVVLRRALGNFGSTPQQTSGS